MDSGPFQDVRDHPRIRGEHSRHSAMVGTEVGSSPHTRGALAIAERLVERFGIIPAYAGSTAYGAELPAPVGDHPRIRGEHGDAFMLTTSGWGSSPHTRGALHHLIWSVFIKRIIPAYAGSTSTVQPMAPASRDHPRIRGEHHDTETSRPYFLGSSPHTRGALRRRARRLNPVWIIPAYAGSTSAPKLTIHSDPDHPRIRGEHSLAARGYLTLRGSSPHTRGAPFLVLGGSLSPRIIPAYAGSTPLARFRRQSKTGSSPHTRGARNVYYTRGECGGIIPAYAGSTSAPKLTIHSDPDHPRIRGEHLNQGAAHRVAQGSSPHTRGAPPDYSSSSATQRIIPAYAGSTPDRCGRRLRAWDHPRIRGEHVVEAFLPVEFSGSSPHTRGAPLPASAGSSAVSDHPRIRGEHVSWIVETMTMSGIIPAYAGSTGTSSARIRSLADHPRIRGEHEPITPPIGDAMGSSPHTRGARDCCRSSPTCWRIIPAYAGSTASTSKTRRGAADHPRIRGEHTRAIVFARVDEGSSPHTRGALSTSCSCGGRARIIPAYAGSTVFDNPGKDNVPDHPRIRGEHEGLRLRVVGVGGSSPHTRGAHGTH